MAILCRSGGHFSEKGARGGDDGLEYVGSWVEANFDRCWQLMECGDAALLVRRKKKPSAEQEAYLERLCNAVADARRLAQGFARMVRDRGGEGLDGWLEEAETSEAPVMRRFAAGLGKDLAAAHAGLTEPWSNGPVEGFVHKLKLVKRQGYERAGFDLLRARNLAA